jgi:predicted transport protein
LPVFSIEGSKLNEVREVAFLKESKLQKLTEDNLLTVFGLKFVSSGFTCRKLIVDTLAFNPETKAFVVIEYKKEKNFTVIDQGYAYLQLVVNNKAEFVLEYNSKMNGKLGKDDIDWTQSRVLFVAPRFTEYQRRSINFKDVPFELWEAHKYDNGTILYDQILPTEAEESIASVSGKSGIVGKVTKEVQVYTEDDHLEHGNPETRILYMEFSNKVSDLGRDVMRKPTKLYMSFKRHTNFADVEIQKSKLRVTINMPLGSLNDPAEIAQNMKDKGHWGVGDYQLIISNESDIEKALPLIKQSYDRN